MTTVATIRTGLATNLATISGLRTSATMPDAINPPIAIVMPDSISYDTTMGRGLDEYAFTILVVVGRADARTSQGSVDAFCNPTGASSIKTAVQSDRTLGGAASSLRVTSMRNYTSITAGDVVYLAAEFAVTVYA
jgi:hypothetical protein